MTTPNTQANCTRVLGLLNANSRRCPGWSTVAINIAEVTGIHIEQVCVSHVDTSFMYRGDGNYDALLIEADVTEKILELLPEVPAWLANHRDILENPIPRCPMNSHCKDCEFKAHCESEQTEYPVSLLPNG